MKALAIAVAVLTTAAICLGFVQSGETSERYWLAAKYDGRQAMIYLDTLKFGDTFPDDCTWLYPASGFLRPCILDPAYVRQMQNRPGAADFAIGKKFDLLMDGNFVQTATVTKLLGWIADEGVGNDSQIGVLVSKDDTDISLEDEWFVARRHVEEVKSNSQSPSQPYAHLIKAPVRFDIETEIVSLMKQRMHTMAPEPVRAGAEAVPPSITVQAFTLADGNVRYYVQCGWESKNSTEPVFAIAAWMDPNPKLHIVGIEKKTSPWGFPEDLPNLLNVLDLGHGRTGVIVSSSGLDDYWLGLLEYRDGGIGKMHELQHLEHGE